MFRWLSVSGSFLVFICLIHLGEKGANLGSPLRAGFSPVQSSPPQNLMADSDSDSDDDDDDDIANMC